jgi:hypothetical protein
VDPWRLLLGSVECTILVSLDPWRLLFGSLECIVLIGVDPWRLWFASLERILLVGVDPWRLYSLKEYLSDPVLFLCLGMLIFLSDSAS